MGAVFRPAAVLARDGAPARDVAESRLAAPVATLHTIPAATLPHYVAVDDNAPASTAIRPDAMYSEWGARDAGPGSVAGLLPATQYFSFMAATNDKPQALQNSAWYASDRAAYVPAAAAGATPSLYQPISTSNSAPAPLRTTFGGDGMLPRHAAGMTLNPLFLPDHHA